MNQCRNTLRHIRESGGTLDRESVEHCLVCPACRRELLALLAAEDPGAPGVPAELDREVLAHCRNGRRFRRSRELRRILGWTGGAAAAAALAASLVFSGSAPTGGDVPPAVADSEWDGSALLARISDIGTELGKMEEFLATK